MNLIKKAALQEFAWTEARVDTRGRSQLETARVLIDIGKYKEARRWIARAIDACNLWVW